MTPRDPRSGYPGRGLPVERALVLLAILVGTIVTVVLTVYFCFIGVLLAASTTNSQSATEAAAVALLYGAPCVLSLLGAAGAWFVNRSYLSHAGRRQTFAVWVGIVVIALTPIELLGLVYAGMKSSPAIAALLDVIRPGWNDADEDWRRQAHVYQFASELTGNPPLDGQPDTLYVSIPDTDTTCSHAGLPPLPAPGRYHCVPPERLTDYEGMGWLPWRMGQGEHTQAAPARSGPPKIDPRNQVARGLFYRFRMLSKNDWTLTVPLARADDFPATFPQPGSRYLQLRRNGNLFVLAGTRHSR